MRTRRGWLIGAALAFVLALCALDSSDDAAATSPRGVVATRALAWGGHDGTRRERAPSPPRRSSTSARRRPSPPLPALLRGRVIDGEGRLVAGASLMLTDREGAVIAAAESDVLGNFALRDPAPSGWHVEVDGDPRPLSPPLRRGEARDLDLVVGSTRRVDGFVTDMDGDPVPGAAVTLSATEFDADWRTTSDAAGAFAFRAAPCSPLVIDALRTDVGRDSTRLEKFSRRTHVSLVMEPTATLTVLGPPGAAGRISIRSNEGWSTMTIQSSVSYPISDEEPFGQDDDAEPIAPDAPALPRRSYDDRRVVAEGGHGATFVLVASVEYRIEVRVGDEPPRSCGKVYLAPADELVITCGLRAPAAASGWLLDGHGRAMGGVVVEMSCYGPTPEQRDWASSYTTTEADGRFWIAMLADAPLSCRLQSVVSNTVLDRDFTLVPGQTIALGGLQVLTGEEVFAMDQREPYSGVGAMIRVTVGYPTEVLDVAPDSPLGLAGVEAGDRILLVDGQPTARRSELGVFVLLGGEPGTLVTLRIRSREGDLYDLEVARAITINPRTWAD